MNDLLFDTPWWMPALIAGVGVMLFWMGNNRQERKVRNAGVGFLLLALILIGISYYVDTPRESAVKNTRRLVDSVKLRDWATMTSLLDPRCAFESYGDRDQIVSAARIAAERFGLKSISVTSLQAEQVDTLITVHLDLLSEQDVTMLRPFPTSWQLDYQKTANGWSLRNINVLESRQPGSQAAVRQNLPNVKLAE